MLFSIIIPVYNGEKVIRRCIDSLLAAWQQVENKEVEIIIVDDGSQDGTPTILAEYSTQYALIRVLHQENKGASTARNAGLATATGEWIGFVDADDYVELDYFHTILNNLDDQLDILIFSFNRVSANSKKTVVFPNVELDVAQVNQMLANFFKNRLTLWYPWNKIYRKSLVQHVRFHQDVFVGEDTNFNINAFSKVRRGIKVLACPLYNYVNNAESTTNGVFWPSFFENIAIQFSANLEIYEQHEVLRNSGYLTDFAGYYLNHSFFWILKNELNNPQKENISDRLRKIRQSDLFNIAFKYYKYDTLSVRRNIFVKLFQLKWIQLLIITVRISNCFKSR